MIARALLQNVFFLTVAFLVAAAIPVCAAQSASAPVDKPAPLPTPPAEKLTIRGVHDAAKVTEFLYRGASPKPEAFAELKRLGITTVVNLRAERGEIESERKRVEALGMRYVSLPLSGWFSPTNEQIAQILVTLRQRPREKIFVHCRYGDDRTGVVIATYRIAEQHWTLEQAIREMDEFHFHNFWHPNMKSYVRKFPETFAKDPAFTQLRSSSPLEPAPH